MTTSSYFNNYNNTIEESLIEDLINEAINIQGFDGYYIPNENLQYDQLYGDDPLKQFKNAYSVELYLSNATDPGMDMDLFTKFGLQIQNSVRVQISKRNFVNNVPQNIITRPREGDLIYIPFLSGNGELYEIKFVNDTKDFFILGRKNPYYYELDLELFKYGNEEIDTGVDDIDSIMMTDSYSIDYTMGNGTGNYKISEIVYQGLVNAPSATGQVANWEEDTKILTLINFNGEFSNTANIIGMDTNAEYEIYQLDKYNKQYQNPMDNKIIDIISSEVIDTSETNTFGNL